MQGMQGKCQRWEEPSDGRRTVDATPARADEERRLRSGLQHLLAKHKALQLIIRIFVVGKQMNKTHEEAPGKKARGGVDNQHRALSLIRRLLGHQQQQQQQ